MKIGPVDIRNRTFTKKMRGVDEQEVRDVLDLAADRLEELILETDDLRTKIDRMEVDLREYKVLERSMRDSMLSAERLVDDRSAQAEKEAQIVIKNAEVQADKLLGQAREDLGRFKAEIDDLRRQKVTYVERFRALLRSQVKILEASLESFDPDGELDAVRSVLEPSPAPPPPPGAPQRPADNYTVAPPSNPASNPYVGQDGLFAPEPGGGEHG